MFQAWPPAFRPRDGKAGGIHNGGKFEFNQIHWAHCCFILKYLIVSLPCTSLCGVAAPAGSTDGDCQTHASSPEPSWRQPSLLASVLYGALFQPFWKLALNMLLKHPPFWLHPPLPKTKSHSIGMMKGSLTSIWGKNLNCGLFVKADKSMTSKCTIRSWFFMCKRKWTISRQFQRAERGLMDRIVRRQFNFNLRNAQLALTATLRGAIYLMVGEGRRCCGWRELAGNLLLHHRKSQVSSPLRGQPQLRSHSSTLESWAADPTPPCRRFLPCCGVDNFESWYSENNFSLRTMSDRHIISAM